MKRDPWALSHFLAGEPTSLIDAARNGPGHELD